MSQDYQAILSRFDPVGLNRYGISALDLEMIERYIRILQSNLPVTAWDEAVAIGREYGTSIIIHEAI